MKHPNKEIMRKLIDFTIDKSDNREEVTGCFIVKGDKVIAKAVSTVGTDFDPTAHGEMNAIKKLCKKQKNYYLHDCWIYSTQIPCPMCTSALVWSEAEGIVYGWDGRQVWGKLDIDPRSITKTAKNKIKVVGPFLEDECLVIKGYKK